MSDHTTTDKSDFLLYKDIPEYHESIEVPLKHDEKSLEDINEILVRSKIGKADPYGQILYSLAGHNLKGTAAFKHWKYMLGHKLELEQRIGRRISVRAAAIDYFDIIGDEEVYLNMMEGKIQPIDVSGTDEDWLSHVFSYKYFHERFQEETRRSRRYKYPLALVLIDIDPLSLINEKYGFKVGDIIITRIVKIIKRSIRTVDILTRFAGDQFALILPHANKREATELAERIRKNVEERSQYVKDVQEPLSITSAVLQLGNDETPVNDFIRRARNLLEKGKLVHRNAVHSEK